jgi:hypothetical protein
MSLRINLRSLRRKFGGLSLGLALLLPACVPQQAATSAPAIAPGPVDPIMRAVATASLAAPVSAVSTAYAGPVTVTVTSDYISAEGQECRSYTLAGGGLPGANAGPTTHLACTDGTNWREIPSLAPSVNPGFSQ